MRSALAPAPGRGYHARVEPPEALDFARVVQALLSNALRQAQEGRCSAISVELSADAVRVTDDGAGLPVHPHPRSGRPLAEVILTGPRRGPVNTLARVNAQCLWLEVETHAEGARWSQRYEFALPGGALERLGPSAARGTSIVCAPARGAPPDLDDLRAFVRETAAAGAPTRVVVHLRDLREPARDETIRLA